MMLFSAMRFHLSNNYRVWQNASSDEESDRLSGIEPERPGINRRTPIMLLADIRKLSTNRGFPTLIDDSVLILLFNLDLEQQRLL